MNERERETIVLPQVLLNMCLEEEGVARALKVSHASSTLFIRSLSLLRPISPSISLGGGLRRPGSQGLRRLSSLPLSPLHP